MSQININNGEDYESRLATAAGKLVVVNFNAAWCGPCKIVDPGIDAYTLAHPNVIFLKVDVDALENIAARYDINHMPTYIYIKNGEVVKEVYGANLPAFILAVETYQ